MLNNYEQTRGGLKDASTNLLYLLIGGGIGATVALLFAPKPGKELRRDVSDGVKHGLEVANETVSQFKETAGEKVTYLKGVADGYYHNAQDTVSTLYRNATKAVNDGTEEAKALGKEAIEEAHNVLENTAPKNEPPLFEAGSKPLDQRNLKTGIL